MLAAGYIDDKENMTGDKGKYKKQNREKEKYTPKTPLMHRDYKKK
jgi:hypothetical protein